MHGQEVHEIDRTFLQHTKDISEQFTKNINKNSFDSSNNGISQNIKELNGLFGNDLKKNGILAVDILF